MQRSANIVFVEGPAGRRARRHRTGCLGNRRTAARVRETGEASSRVSRPLVDRDRGSASLLGRIPRGNPDVPRTQRPVAPRNRQETAVAHRRSRLIGTIAGLGTESQSRFNRNTRRNSPVAASPRRRSALREHPKSTEVLPLRATLRCQVWRENSFGWRPERALWHSATRRCDGAMLLYNCTYGYVGR